MLYNLFMMVKEGLITMVFVSMCMEKSIYEIKYDLKFHFIMIVQVVWYR